MMTPKCMNDGGGLTAKGRDASVGRNVAVGVGGNGGSLNMILIVLFIGRGSKKCKRNGNSVGDTCDVARYDM